MSEAACERCGGTGYVIVEYEGMSAAQRCPCFFDRLAGERIPRAGIPEKFANATFDNFILGDPARNPVAHAALKKVYSDIKRYAREYLPTLRKPGLLILGDHGIGKTHLAVAAFKEILRKGFDGTFFDFQSLLDRIQAGWNPAAGTAEKETYQTALETPVLLLDDLGARRSIDWVEDTVTAIITHRCNNNKTLIATSNLPLEARLGAATTPAGTLRYEKSLAEVIGRRSASRLYEMCRIVEMPDLPDYRPNITN
jgi:DNA replication protein DnaC